MQEVYFQNGLAAKETMIFLVGQPNAQGQAEWSQKPPDTIDKLAGKPTPPQVRRLIKLPVGGSLAVSYKRTDLTPNPQVHVTIQRNAHGVQVTVVPTNPNQLNVSPKQTGDPDDVQVNLNFKGE